MELIKDYFNVSKCRCPEDFLYRTGISSLPLTPTTPYMVESVPLIWSTCQSGQRRQLLNPTEPNGLKPNGVAGCKSSPIINVSLHLWQMLSLDWHINRLLHSHNVKAPTNKPPLYVTLSGCHRNCPSQSKQALTNTLPPFYSCQHT